MSETGRVKAALQTYSRRAVLRAAVGMAGAAALAACGGESATPGGGAAPTAAGTAAGVARPTTAPTTAPPAGVTPTSTTAARPARPKIEVEGYLPSPAPGVPDAYTKPLPPDFPRVKTVSGPPGRGRKLTTMEIFYGQPPAPRGQNQYWQYLEQQLNVNPYEANLTPAPTYQEKLAAIIASGDLPDLTWVDYSFAPTLGRLFQQGAFTDLTPHLRGEALQEFANLATFPPQLWENVAVNKKIFGAPRPRFIPGGTLMFRQDWADKLGAPRPRNSDEFFNLLLAMTKNDPDGNGRADTWGMTTQGSPPDFNVGFFGQLYRAPNGWRLNQDGSLTNMVETAEYQQGLAFARRLFEAGGYHPDAATMNVQQAKDAFNSGRVGAYGDGITALPNLGGLRAKSKEVTLVANAVGLVPFGHDGGPAVYHNSTGFFGQTAIPAKVGQDRERVKELLRVLNWFAAPFGSEEAKQKDGIEGVHYTVTETGETRNTDLGNVEKAGFGGIANAPPVFYYPRVPGDAEYMQGLVRDLLAIGIADPTWGVFSPTSASRGGELSQFIADRRLAIVLGREPLGAWDTALREWKSRGGDQIRQEYEEALKAQ